MESDMDGTEPVRVLKSIILTGLAIVIPGFVTLYIIWFVIGQIRQTLRPIVGLLEDAGVIGFFQRRELIIFLLNSGFYSDVIDFLSEIIAILLFFLLILVVGAVARYRYGEVLISTFDYLIASIPGVGTVYQTLRRVGDLVLGDNVSEFETVVLVEMLSAETYLIAFQTGSSPDSVAEATDGDEMVSLFVPMAPNPVTGGFLVYVPRNRVVDVDLSVDDAVRAVLTSGLATEEPDQTILDRASERPSPGVRTNVPESASIRSAMNASVLNDLVGASDNSADSEERSGEQ
jgi:uncharacterized membrane protein